jgi:hypothetical protein
VWESRKQAMLPYTMLAVLIGSIFLLTSTGLYLQDRMDSGSYWIPFSFEYVEVDLNATVPQVNVTIETMRLNIPHFNVSSSNASILVIAQNNTILLNHTAVTGYWIQGVLSPNELPDSNTLGETYTVSLTWDGTNSTVIFEYEMHALLFWDGVPYTVILPGFYETLIAGLSLLAISGILFMYSIWSADSSVSQGMRRSEYLVLLTGFLLPTLLRLSVTESSAAYGILSSFWYYLLVLGPWVVSMVSAPTRFYSDTLALIGLPLNLIICAALLLFRHGHIRNSDAKLFVYLSFLPQILALLINVYSLVVHVSPAIYYIPIPLLQIAALRWLAPWSPDKTGETL